MIRCVVLKGSGRQRAQEGILLCKATGPASFPLLEGLVVESLQAFVDRLIQLRQRQELAVPQSRQNEGGDDADGAFHRCFILVRADSGRKDRCAVMLASS